MAVFIKNGILITDERIEKAGLLISNGKIDRWISASDSDLPTDCTQIIDAQGMYIIPGGIDPHVHLQMETQAGLTGDDFRSGSITAMMGGTTTIIDFATPTAKQTLPDAIHQRMYEAENSVLDYSLHARPSGFYPELEMEIQDAMQIGIKSFKLNLAYLETIGINDDVAGQIIQLIGKNGGMVSVHAEQGKEIERLRNEYYANGFIEPRYHPLSRPPQMEAKSVENLINLAQQSGCALYVMHLSAHDSLMHIAQAQQAGQKVYGETCPHYLLLNDAVYDQPFDKAAGYVISPPLRKKFDNESLWDALVNGTIQTIATDHCPFQLAQKRIGIADFRKIPNGAGSIEHRLAMLYTYGVLQNRISLNHWVSATSTAAAKIFGLYPQKGNLNPGSDADVVVWNPNTEQVVSATTHHQNSDINIYEGMKTIGQPAYVLCRGEILVENGKFMDSNRKGVFVHQKS
ncbi:MAG TPA: dihydropyrimidinase [Bacteroidales bacterium]|nr:dihydropyrimidinase [Bacteroidales bacterium]